MKLNLNSIWKYVAGGGTVLGYQAFYERMVNKNQTTEFKDAVNSINNKLDLIYEDACKNTADKSEILEMKRSFKEFKGSMKELSDIQNNYCKKHAEITDNENSKSLFESYKEEFGNAFNKAKEVCDNIDKKYNNSDNSINKLSNDDNYIIKLINEFKDYLSNLSITEICLVINISSCLFILTCLVTILLAVYGNFIINKFSLEEKYPKIAKLVKLRVKLQHTYILVNTLLILVVLILMIIINFITLTNG
jgi:hypothetical protein